MNAIFAKQGGPAFPQQHKSGTETDIYFGLSVRDYFAAMAMQGICAHPDNWGMTITQFSEAAYGVADAMLKAREAA